MPIQLVPRLRASTQPSSMSEQIPMRAGSKARLALPLFVLFGCSVGAETGLGSDWTDATNNSTGTSDLTPTTDDSKPNDENDSSSTEPDDSPDTTDDDPQNTTQDDDTNPNTLPTDDESTEPSPRCDDVLHNGNESDVDCGGPDCPACTDGYECQTHSDCISLVCAEGICQSPSCVDNTQNGDETDRDCGGPDCPRCAGGQSCLENRDCRSDACEEGICSQESCTQDADCSHLDDLCAEGFCDTTQYECARRSSNEGQACDTDTPCIDNERCFEGACTNGEARDCSHLEDDCTTASCNEMSDSCVVDDLIIWRQTFDSVDSNANGWRVNNGNSAWIISPAQASSGCFNGQDPANDHTDTSNNRLIGTNVGGCHNSATTSWDCLYSPQIDLRNADASTTLRFWRHLHSPSNADVVNDIILRRSDGTWVAAESGYNNAVNDTSWREMNFSLRDYRHANFAFGICYRHTDGFVSYMAGWSADDFSIAPSACQPYD